MFKKVYVNYSFFGALFLFLFCLTLSSAAWVESPLLFSLHAVLQIGLELGLCLLLSYALKTWVFGGFCFFLMLVQYTDFLMVRVKDSSVSYLFKFFLGSGWEHCFAAFGALNLNKTMAVISLGSLVLVPAMGLLFYRVTEKLSQLAPREISPFRVGLATLLCAAGVLGVEWSLPRQLQVQHARVLPWGSPFFIPKPERIVLKTPFPQARDEGSSIALIPEKMERPLPNIYMFVVETLRRDYITQAIAPHLTALSKEYGEFDLSMANANASQISWFALFHSALPYQWTSVRDQWSEGALGLQWLKKQGYQIRVYSSADLRYFDMDQVLFGKGRKLLDAIEEYTDHPSLEPCDRDQMAIAAVTRDLETHPIGTAFILFLDATHSEYSFPKNWPCQFLPIIKQIDYLTIRPEGPSLEGLKNRYRNSIQFVDHLIGGFIGTLKEKKLLDEAVIAITGDHGEEFFEEGALFHGTHLNRYQLHVPIILKAGDWRPQSSSVTHMDIFPSILHFVSGEPPPKSLFDGKSVFEPGERPPRMAVLDNGPDAPQEFLLDELHARFTKDPFVIEKR